MSQPKFKPSRSGEKHRGYYGAAPVKEEEGIGGLRAIPEAQGMKPPLKSPCVECPLRRDSAPGYLGGYTPEMYVDVLHSPASLACHASEGFHEGETHKQRHCTGVAAYRANVGHHCHVGGRLSPAHAATCAIGQDREHYFASPAEFVDHHKPGQKR